MTKRQKILLSVFLGLFIVPELLWSPVANFVYEWSQNSNHVVPLRLNFLTYTDNADLWSKVLFIQFIGLLSAAVYIVILRKKIINKTFFWFSFISVAFLTVFLFIIYSLSSIKISLF